jgi:hypothetical protein
LLSEAQRQQDVRMEWRCSYDGHGGRGWASWSRSMGSTSFPWASGCAALAAFQNMGSALIMVAICGRRRQGLGRHERILACAQPRCQAAAGRRRHSCVSAPTRQRSRPHSSTSWGLGLAMRPPLPTLDKWSCPGREDYLHSPGDGRGAEEAVRAQTLWVVTCQPAHSLAGLAAVSVVCVA